MIIILIAGIIVNSAGLAIPNAQSTSDEDNKTHKPLMKVINAQSNF